MTERGRQGRITGRFGTGARRAGAAVVLAGVALAACSSGPGRAGTTTGTLAVVITAANGGATGTVAVSGPGGFRRTLSSSTDLASLPPGRYLLDASSAARPGGAWWPPDPTEAAVVAAGRTTTVDETYDVDVPSTTKVVSPAAVVATSPVTSATAQGVLVLRRSAAAGLAPGDIITAGTGPETPDGLLRKVVSVTPDGADLTVMTVGATLAEAVPTGAVDVDLTGQPPAALTQDLRMGGQQVPVVLASSSGPQLRALWSLGNGISCGGGVSIGGDEGVSFYPSVVFKLNWSFFAGLQSAKFEIELHDSAHLEIQGTRAAECKWSHDEPSVELMPPEDIQVGPVPVVVVLEWNMSESLTGELATSSGFGFTQSATAGLGLAYSNGRISPIKTFQYKFEPLAPSGSKISVTAAMGPKFELALYGIAGPYVSVQLVGTGTIASSGGGASLATIEAGVQAGAGFKFNKGPFGFDLSRLDVSIPDLLKFEVPIYSQKLTGPGPNGNGSGAAAALSSYLSGRPHPLVATAPVTTSGGTFAFVLYQPKAALCSYPQRPLPGAVLSYSGRRWSQLAAVSVSLPDGCVSSPGWTSSNSVQVVDVTHSETPDFLVQYQTGVNFGEVGVFVGHSSSGWGVLQFAPHQTGAISPGIFEAPMVTTSGVSSLLFSCNPDCAIAQQHLLKWTYQQGRGFVLSSVQKCGQPGQVLCSDERS